MPRVAGTDYDESSSSFSSSRTWTTILRKDLQPIGGYKSKAMHDGYGFPPFERA